MHLPFLNRLIHLLVGPITRRQEERVKKEEG